MPLFLAQPRIPNAVGDTSALHMVQLKTDRQALVEELAAEANVAAGAAAGANEGVNEGAAAGANAGAAAPAPAQPGGAPAAAAAPPPDLRHEILLNLERAIGTLELTVPALADLGLARLRAGGFITDAAQVLFAQALAFSELHEHETIVILALAEAEKALHYDLVLRPHTKSLPGHRLKVAAGRTGPFHFSIAVPPVPARAARRAAGGNDAAAGGNAAGGNAANGDVAGGNAAAGASGAAAGGGAAAGNGAAANGNAAAAGGDAAVTTMLRPVAAISRPAAMTSMLTSGPSDSCRACW